MESEVAFVSDAFRPVLPEESQVNPECYGAELAWWLCQKLMKKGVPTTYPNFEDWGWFIEYVVDGNEYWLCCGHVDGSKNRAALRELLDESEAVTEVAWRSN